MSTRTLERLALAIASAATVLLAAANPAWASPNPDDNPYTVVPNNSAGRSWNGLGDWEVRYQRVEGGDPDVIAAINDGIDAAASEHEKSIEWRPSTTHHWTFTATGTLYIRPNTVSELFTGEYNTDLPNMPFHTISSRVYDSRNGTPITWDNLFQDKGVGLTRLSEQTAAILPTAYPPPQPDAWKSASGMAPVADNFKYWIPTDAGIELHFPDYQFGRGLKVITVPWARVHDLIAPQFFAIVA